MIAFQLARTNYDLIVILEKNTHHEPGHRPADENQYDPSDQVTVVVNKLAWPEGCHTQRCVTGIMPEKSVDLEPLTSRKRAKIGPGQFPAVRCFYAVKESWPDTVFGDSKPFVLGQSVPVIVLVD